MGKLIDVSLRAHQYHRVLNFCSHKNEYPQRRKHPNQPTPLLPPSNAAIPVNGHSDLESGDETQQHHHHTSNEYTTEPFTR